MARRADAPRDLLFGLLALQNGMVDSSQLVAAFGAWTLAKDRPMAEVLVAHGVLSEPRRALLDALLAEHLMMHDGDPQKSLASLEAGRSTRESLTRLADAELEATLSHVGSGSSTDCSPFDRTASYAVGISTAHGQRFRILRPHARGGLGAVFVALDEELHREVALKQIQDVYADDHASRARFVQEAEITGGLEHPGIVPVYGLGTYADGRPYYAMRFIRGDSLKQAIDRFHAEELPRGDPGARGLELRKLLRRFQDVCNAIDYAHQRGVLHRDLKPGNIIVGRYGETLVVDWGLAKAVGRADPRSISDERTLAPSSSESAETVPGLVLGTPAYMSPEQASGDIAHLGPRSDVYSLGATLYCLLTGKPPFPGDDVGRILKDVQQGAYSAPRIRDPTIAPALEAICEKAMALEPANRYGSPKALAEDIERWMADEPVSARREPAAERARRWMRRRRTAVAAAGAAVLVALAALVVVLAVQARANRDLRHANTRERARFDLATEAIKTFHTGVSEDLLLKQKEFKELRTKLLRDARMFYGRLERLLENQSDRPSRAALGRAFYDLGNLTDQIGSKEEALAAHRRALAVREGLARGASADTASVRDLALSVGAVANLMRETGKPDEAMRAYERARDVWRALAKTNPNVSQFQRGAGNSYTYIGWNLFQNGRTSEALAALGTGRDILESLTKAHADDAAARSDLAHSYHNLGIVLSATGHPAEALAAYERARDIRQPLAKARPNATQIQTDLAWTLHNMGDILADIGRMEEARESYRRVLLIRQALAKANPNITEFQNDLASSHYANGTLLAKSGKLDEALRAFERALAVTEPLAEANPTVTELQKDRATDHYVIAGILAEIGRPAEAMAAYARALEILEPLAKANPTLGEIQSRLAATLHNRGDLLVDAGRRGEALASFRRALLIEERLAKANPTVTQYQDYLANHHASIGWVLSKTGHPNEAVTSYKRAVEIRQALARANPTVAEFQSAWAANLNNFGNRLLEAGRNTEALDAFTRALEIQAPLAKAEPTVTQYQNYLANHHANIGKVLARTGRPLEAIASYGRALEIREPLARANPRVAGFQSELAGNLEAFGDLLFESGRRADALAAYERALALREKLSAAHVDDPSLHADAAATSLELGILKARAGDPSGALALCQLARKRLDRIPKPSADTLFSMARARAQIAGLVAKVPPEPMAESSDTPSAHREAAMNLLRRAIAGGYRDLGAISDDRAFEPLRSRPDFQLLMMDLAFPTELFAPPR